MRVKRESVMEKILNLLSRHQKVKFYNQRDINQKVKELKKSPTIMKLVHSFKTPLDFYQANLIKQGLLNKTRLENDYESIRQANQTIWDGLNYHEKVMIARLDGQTVRSEIPYFIFQDKKMFIPFFDERLNHYYLNEMAIFDINQYFNIYRDFEKHLVAIDTYKGTPYNGLNAGCVCLLDDEKGYVLWDPQSAVMSVVKDKAYFFRLDNVSNVESLKALASHVLNDEVVDVIQLLQDNQFVSTSTLKKIKKGRN